MKKSLTLIELLIAIALMGVVILGAFAFENASRNLLRTSERKVDVLNDLTFVMEHLHKNILLGIGDVTASDRMALTLAENPQGVFTLSVWQDTNQDGMLNITDGSDVQVQYVFDPANHTITFEGEVLADKLMPQSKEGNNFGIVIEDGGLRVQNMSMIYDVDLAEDPNDNPQLEIREQYFFPLGQSLS